MFYFIGCLVGYGVCSGFLLNLNIHPIIWKLILNQTIEFSEYETIDKLFYKLMVDINNTTIKDSKDFETVYDLYYTIQTSDGTEVDLVNNGKKIQVT